MLTTGQKIKQRRLELGLSVEDVAKALNKSISTVYRYESEDIKNFNYEVLGDLAFVLNTTPAELLGIGVPKNVNLGSNKLIKVSPIEQNILDDYRRLNDTARRKVEFYLDDLCANKDNWRHKKDFKKRIPNFEQK